MQNIFVASEEQTLTLMAALSEQWIAECSVLRLVQETQLCRAQVLLHEENAR